MSSDPLAVFLKDFTGSVEDNLCLFMLYTMTQNSCFRAKSSNLMESLTILITSLFVILYLECSCGKGGLLVIDLENANFILLI